MRTKTELTVKNKEGKRTRGYRLKPSTHKLIVKIQALMHSDQDEAIAGACIMFYSELKKNGNSKQLKLVSKS